MLHWIHNPKKGTKRFVEENVSSMILEPAHPAVQHVLEIAKMNGVRPSDLRSLQQSLNPDKLKEATTSAEIVAQILHVFDALLDDLNFDTPEQDFLIQFAVSIGVPSIKAPQIIKDMYFMLRNEMPAEEIIKTTEIRF